MSSRHAAALALLVVLSAAACVLAPIAAGRSVRVGRTTAPATTRTHKIHRHRRVRHRRRVRATASHAHVEGLTQPRPVVAAAGLTQPWPIVSAAAPAATTSASAVAPLRFGIYPWAAVGAVGTVDPALVDQPDAALAAVKQLQGGRSFVVRLYGEYSGTDLGADDALLSDITWWSSHGVEVEAVLRYRPASPSVATGFAPWAAAVATRLAAVSGVVAIQIGNEGNAIGSAAASDGAYAGAVSAIAAGVIAARHAVLAAGRPDIAVGFNWAAGENPCAPDPYFAWLARAGGGAFVSAVGWVGIDVYPGTWSAPATTPSPSPDAIAASVTSALGCLRGLQMPSAGLPTSVPITVAETGYPTDMARSEASQASALEAIVAAVRGVALTDNVSDLRWFGLRDANTASGQLENGYGLLRDDYSAKPAFAAYAALVAADGR